MVACTALRPPSCIWRKMSSLQLEYCRPSIINKSCMVISRSRSHVGGLDHGVELAGVLPLLARTEARVFAAAERHVVIGAGGGQVDHHATGAGAALEVA